MNACVPIVVLLCVVTASIGVLGPDTSHGLLARSVPIHGTQSSLSGHSTGTNDGAVVATIGVGQSPEGLVYDSGNGYVYVANQGSDSVSAISGSTVVANISVGTSPLRLAYDSRNGYVYVTDWTSSNVGVISGTKLLALVPVGELPSNLVVDPSNGYVYVTNEGGGLNPGNVSVLTGTGLVASISAGTAPWGIAYDSEDNEVYVGSETSGGGGELYVVSGISVVGTIPLPQGPQELLYDNTSGDLYVGGISQSPSPACGVLPGTVSVVSGLSVLATLQVGCDPTALAYDPVNGNIYVPTDASSNVSVISGTRLLGTIPVDTWGGGISVDEANGNVYVGDFLRGDIVVLSGTQVVERIPVGFNRSSGTAYLLYDKGDGEVYASDSGTNEVSIISMNPAFPVSFAETGLPTGASWGVSLSSGGFNDTSTGSATVLAIDGTYSYEVGGLDGYLALPGNGTVTVSGAPEIIPVTFHAHPSAGMYFLNFTETGLPPGTAWSVSVDEGCGRCTVTSNVSIVTYIEWNGNYTYTVNPVPGYIANVSSGVTVVQNHSTTILVKFIRTNTGGRSSLFYGWAGLGIGATAVVLTVLVILFFHRRRGRQSSTPGGNVVKATTRKGATAKERDTLPTGLVDVLGYGS